MIYLEWASKYEPNFCRLFLQLVKLLAAIMSLNVTAQDANHSNPYQRQRFDTR